MTASTMTRMESRLTSVGACLLGAFVPHVLEKSKPHVHGLRDGERTKDLVNQWNSLPMH